MQDFKTSNKSANTHRLLFSLFFISTLCAILWLPPAAAATSTAIEGYDPVAYFTLKRAVRGSEKFSYHWNNDTWLFVTEEHKNLFAKNPNKYAPQFNGFCANGLSDGHVIEADPENWRVIDGKLYLFFSSYGRDQWGGNVKSLIQSAKDTLQEH